MKIRYWPSFIFLKDGIHCLYLFLIGKRPQPYVWKDYEIEYRKKLIDENKKELTNIK